MMKPMRGYFVADGSQNGWRLVEKLDDRMSYSV